MMEVHTIYNKNTYSEIKTDKIVLKIASILIFYNKKSCLLL